LRCGGSFCRWWSGDRSSVLGQFKRHSRPRVAAKRDQSRCEDGADGERRANAGTGLVTKNGNASLGGSCEQSHAAV
jgi:hypothetical protein